MSTRRLVLALCFAACRFDFETHTSNLVSDGPVDIAIDAPPPCLPFANGETVADCAAAFLDPASAPDQVVYDCAISCQFHACKINDASACTMCACTAYAYDANLCDMSGNCSAPLSGTGCVGGGFYGGPPMSCPGGLVPEGACVIRYLISNGLC